MGVGVGLGLRVQVGERGLRPVLADGPRTWLGLGLGLGLRVQ